MNSAAPTANTPYATATTDAAPSCTTRVPTAASAAATAYTLYAIATTDAAPSCNSRVATAASTAFPTAPDWHALSTTTGTRAAANAAATSAAGTRSALPPGRSNTSTPCGAEPWN